MGKRYGYNFDGWMADGCYHYTGEGQHGDQKMKSGNAAIFSYKQDGRALRLFKGVRGEVEYLGEFETDEEQPYYTTDAPEAHNGPVRSVIVFRLRPLVKTVTRATADEVVASSNKVKLVPIEEQYTERAFVEPGREPMRPFSRWRRTIRSQKRTQPIEH